MKYNFEEFKNSRLQGYNGFNLNKNRLILSKNCVFKNWESIDIKIDKNKKAILVVKGNKYKVKTFQKFTHVYITRLHEVMPRGRYVFKESIDNAHVFILIK